jgi:hypothetical protein
MSYAVPAMDTMNILSHGDSDDIARWMRLIYSSLPHILLTCIMTCPSSLNSNDFLQNLHAEISESDYHLSSAIIPFLSVFEPEEAIREGMEHFNTWINESYAASTPGLSPEMWPEWLWLVDDL